MFKDAIDQMKDDDYIDKLHRQINGLKNDLEMVDQQNLSILKTAEKHKRKAEKLEQQNKRYREALEEISTITLHGIPLEKHINLLRKIADEALEGESE